MFLFGLIFALVGGGVGLLFFIIGLVAQVDDPMFRVMFCGIGGLFFVLFGGIGIMFMLKEKKKQRIAQEILELGEKVYGAKIIDYRDGSGVYVNGMPPLNIVVDCVFRGEPRQMVVETGSFDETKYPIGAYCDLAIYGTEIAIIPGSVRF